MNLTQEEFELLRRLTYEHATERVDIGEPYDESCAWCACRKLIEALERSQEALKEISEKMGRAIDDSKNLHTCVILAKSALIPKSKEA